MKLLAVKLDSEIIGAGPATVVAHCATIVLPFACWFSYLLGDHNARQG